MFYDYIASFNELCFFLCLIVVLKLINVYMKVIFRILFSSIIKENSLKTFKIGRISRHAMQMLKAISLFET